MDNFTAAEVNEKKPSSFNVEARGQSSESRRTRTLTKNLKFNGHRISKVSRENELSISSSIENEGERSYNRGQVERTRSMVCSASPKAQMQWEEQAIGVRGLNRRLYEEREGDSNNSTERERERQRLNGGEETLIG